jgi:hypothetical protein
VVALVVLLIEALLEITPFLARLLQMEAVVVVGIQQVQG